MLRILLISAFIFTATLFSFSQSNDFLTEEELEDAVVYTDLDDALKNTAEVYILDLSSQGLTKLPKEVSRFRNVQIVILSDNQLTEIPAELTKLKKLQVLRIDSNNIETLYFDTSDPRNFQSLESIYVGFNPIKTIPENIKNIDLGLVSLSGCKYLDINKIFTSLAAIKSLDYLDLSYLNLDTIPWEVANLYGLRTLDLSANPSMDWDTSMRFLSQNKSIEELILHNNRFSTITEEFSRFENLHSLDLSYNDKLSIKQVFEVTKNCKQLNTIDLSFCQLRELPKSIGDQKKLFELYLSHNRLSRIPGEIGLLEQLELVDLSFNELTELPEQFGDLQSLEYLLLGNNPLEFLPRNMSNLNDIKYVELPKDSLDKQVKKSLKDIFSKAEIVFIKGEEDN